MKTFNLIHRIQRVNIIESRVIGIFLVAGLVLLVAGYFVYRMTGVSADAARWVNHTEAVRTQLSQFYATAIETQLALNTDLSDSQHLAEVDYRDHAALLNSELHALKILVSDNPAQVINVESLTRLTDEFKASVSPMRHPTSNTNTANRIAANNNSKYFMQLINAKLQFMNRIENNLLIQRETEMTNSRSQALWALIWMLLLALISFIPLWLMIHREILSRAKAESLALSVNNQLQAVLMSASEVSIIATNQEGKITLFNTGAENLLEYSAEEVIGKFSLEQFHDSEEVVRRGQELSQSNQTQLNPFAVLSTIPAREGQERRIWTYLTRSGARIPVSLGITCIHTDDGAINGYLGIALDISERQKMERSLVEAKETAEQANYAKRDFLATMSHEIRTPLTGMLGMLELLTLTNLDKEQRTMLNLVWDSSRHLLRIVNDILDWSKIEEGKLSISPFPTNISQLLKSIINTYSGLASIKGLILLQYSDPRLSTAHNVDALRLTQILNNFISNAIKFTEHGQIEVRADLITVTNDSERICFSVRDTGIGIPHAMQARLFQRYQQESGETTRLYGGTGLGLAICSCLADLMEGEISVNSEPELGATFSVTLTLPVAYLPEIRLPSQQSEALPEIAEELQLPSGYDKLTILVVDDHPINRDMLSRQIKYLGLVSDTAENGVAALFMWQTQAYDLIITDCHMPEMDGYTLARNIRQIEALEHRHRVPIIGWTANALTDETLRCQAAGMDELLIKPVELMQLKSMLIKWLAIPYEKALPAPMKTMAYDSISAPSVIDYSILSKMVPDQAEQKEVLYAFQKHIETDSVKMQQLTELDDIARSAHRMKGACLMVGAQTLVDIYTNIERSAQHQDWKNVHISLHELENAVTLLSTHIQS